MFNNLLINNLFKFNCSYMKKFLSFLMATVVAFTAFSHTTDTKFFDNTYITVKGGATALTHPQKWGYEDWGHSIQAATSLQVGKWITPTWGAAIDGTMGIRNGSKYGAFQSYGIQTDLPEWATPAEAYLNKINYVTVSALAKYRIPMGRFNVVAAAGPSWVHGFSYINDINDIGTKFQVEFNYDLTDRLQLNLVPEFNYNFTANQGNQPKFNSVTSWYGVLAGLTFNMGGKFEECPYTYTQADVDALNAKINELQSRQPEVVIRDHVVEKVINGHLDGLTVLFDKGSYVIPEVYKHALSMVEGEVNVIGSYSFEGSEDFNNELAKNRAQAVADEIAKSGKAKVKSVTVDNTLGSRVAIVK